MGLSSNSTAPSLSVPLAHGGSSHRALTMGGCHSYTSTSGSVREADASSKAEEFCDIIGHKLKNNNTQAAPSLEEKPYLMQDYVSERIAEIDVRTLTELPEGFDKAEWMASHSEYRPGENHPTNHNARMRLLHNAVFVMVIPNFAQKYFIY
ncbi:hypothetical protein JZ751_028878 [Albula glossodonta]|uniref:Uncharacterized protein n=1 Tax=Albula glossodonta TaxID=121402 RepID=A0A8T2NDD8_9TELE|nr:hypothetical protein JZ751_028878 [Albula glossodonta]